MKIMTLMAATLAVTLTACGTLQAGPSVFNKDASPRAAAVQVKEDVGPAVADLADLCETGLLSADVKAVVVKYGPKIREGVGAYADSAEACVVIDGALQTDPAAGEQCARGTVKAVTSSLPRLLIEAGRSLGLETGTGYRLYIAGFAARRIVGTNTGGVIDGFSKEPDLTREEYLEVWKPVQADADRLMACAGR